MGWESSDVIFDLRLPVKGRMRVAKLESGYNSFIIGARGLECETNLQKIMPWKFSDVVRFDLGPLH